MPRWASRITLEITGIRCELIRMITEQDAICEGIRKFDECPETPEPKAEFARLWCSINGSESWDANPWVWVVDFKRI